MIFALFFLFGISVGSFLNVLIDRLPRDEKISGRSYCDNCKKQLKWYDLIPIFGFLILRGKCRDCHQKISFQYPLVELISGILFVFVFRILDLEFVSDFGFRISDLMNFVYILAVISFLIIIFFSDLKYYIIPDKIIYPAIGVSGTWYLVSSIFFNFYTKYQILNTAYAAIGAGVFFLALFLVSRGKWLGFGDVKLGVFMGLVLGWPNILAALFLAYITGAIIGVGLIASGRKKLKSEVPFGPFLVVGTLIALFYGEEIIRWHTSFIGI